MREWLVIESSGKNSVYADDAKTPLGYIPRDEAEKLLGRDLGSTVWFTRDESEKMRHHPEWCETEPVRKNPMKKSEKLDIYHIFLGLLTIWFGVYVVVMFGAIVIQLATQ
jgi:hypothetical protein